ncbi:MAG: PT domain-containing protein [Firmicutes bacterium]|nr:PT domain-containing protein [Bacillota bacterium]
MKKILIIILALSLIFALCACGSSGQPTDEPANEPVNEPAGEPTTDPEPEPDPDFQWTREGFFEDGSGCYVSIAASEDPEFPGWYVTLDTGDIMMGGYIQQEGETLHGNIGFAYDMNLDEFIVTVHEDGDDGILLETEDGDTFRFTRIESEDD